MGQGERVGGTSTMIRAMKDPALWLPGCCAHLPTQGITGQIRSTSARRAT